MRPEPATALLRLTRLAHAPRAWSWLVLVLVGLLCVQNAALAMHDLEHAHAVEPDCVVCHVVAQPPLLEARVAAPAPLNRLALLPPRLAEAVSAPRLFLSPPLRAPPAPSLA